MKINDLHTEAIDRVAVSLRVTKTHLKIESLCAHIETFRVVHLLWIEKENENTTERKGGG